MQTTSNRFVGQVKHAAAGNWLTVFSVLFLGLFATPAKFAAQQPIVATGPAVQVGIMKFTPPGGSSTGGGWDSGASPVGGTLVIGANGNVIVGDGYGNVDAFEITPSGAQSILAQGGGGNSSAAAIDSYGNVYVAYEYNGNVYKIPYNAQSGAYAGFTTAPTSNCKGGTQDANACIFAPNVQSVSGIAAIAFDQRGNFIFATDDNGGTKNAVYVCNAACQAETDGQGTNAPVKIYSDTNAIGAIAADPWGNLFFSDGASGSSGKVSNLQEMVFTAGTGTYASPAVVESYTNSDGYTNGISGVTIGSNGTVYFSTNTDGIFAIPNSSSGLNLSGIYVVVGSAAGSKAITVDSHGNFAFIPYSNTLSEDVISWIPTGSFQLGATAVAGTALTATATIVDSGGSCTPTLTYAPTQFGVASTEYSVTAGSGCSAALGSSNGTFNPAISVTGSVTSATISFVPKAVGMRNATLPIRDSADNAAGTVALSGVGQSEWPLLDPAPTTAYTTNLSSPSSVVADSAGDVFVADAGSSKVWEFVGSNAPVSIGSGLAAPTALAFDANGDLFIGDNNSSGGPFVYEIANTGPTGTFVAGTQQTVISSSTLFNATALVSVQALAFGPDGTLYIADNLGARVVTFNPATGNIAVTSAVSGNGLQSPAGIAVDSSSNLYIADSGANKIFIFSAAGGISSVTPPVAISKASAVAVDASGSLIVGDSQSSNVVWIPNMGGTLSTSNAATIESISPQVSSLWLDSKGDLYAASAFGKGAYAIQRSQGASVNFGSIVDGNSSSATIFFENSGNESTTLSASAITAPGNPLFSLVAASTNPCGNSLSLPAGGYCEMTAEFAPITGTAAGAINTSGAINFSPSTSETINLSGTAATSSLPIPTISFTPPSPVLIGQQVNLNTYASDSGTVTSTSPFTFTISPSSPCASCASLSGTTLTALSAGTITITANQAGNSSYAAAAPVAGSITIQAATTGGIPALSLNQATFIGDFCPGYCGGFTSGNNPAGGSIAINSLGDVIDGDTYGNNIQIWAPSSTGYTQTTVKNGGAGGAAVDASNNIYATYLYYPQIWKVPFINGAYATTLPATVPNCVGTGGTTPDKTPCLFNPSGLVNSEPGITAIAFDTNGNLFFVSEPNTTTGFNGIYMIPAASLTSISNGSVAATPVYTADPYTISSITLDANNNLFFTDSNFCSTNTNPCAAPTSINSDLSVSESSGSNLYELADSGGTYSGTPVLLQSFADSTPGNYDNALSGVAADRTNGIVYFSTIQSGIWAFANNGTPFTSSSLPTFYAVAGPNGTSSNATNMTGGKGLAVGAPGTLYAVGGDSTSDDLYMLTMGSATAPLTPLNTTSTTSAVVVDNAFSCGKAATLAISSTNPVFAATSGTTCKSIAVGSGTFSTAIAASSSYPASITFSPLVGGSQTSTLSISDTANGGTGSATVTGVGQETPQTITIASIPTQTYSPTLQLTLSATGGGSNNPITFTIDSSSTGTGTITGNMLTVTQAGNIVLDANQPGGLVNGVFYEAAPQVQLSFTINKATQTISFAPPSSPVTYAPGLTVTLNATGGASGNAIAFSVDSSSTGNGTISGNTLTITQAGNILIDANQTGNVDYLAAIQMQQTLVVNQAAQSITFVPITQPFHNIASGGAALAVQAAGGASDQPIVFTVDASSTMKGSFSSSAVSGATSTATLTLPAQTATSGTIVIDATQPGNSNYSAAAQVQETINVLAPLPTQTITFNNPGTQVVSTPLSLTATASSGFPVSYAATPSSICTVAQSGAAWSATFVATGNCSITASQPGDNLYFASAPSVTQTFIVNPKGQVPAMALAFSSSTINMQPGTNGLTQLTIGSTNNFTGQVSFACSGLPTGYTCTFNPNPISVAAGGSATTTLTVTSSSTAALHREPRPFYPVATLAVVLCLLGFRKRNRLYMFLLVAVGIIGFGLLNGCGGSSSASLTSQVKSTNVTVTATSGSVQQTTTLTILVE